MKIGDEFYEDIYKTAMDGIYFKVAMQSIRKIIRKNDYPEEIKLKLICSVVHSYEKDLEERKENK